MDFVLLQQTPVPFSGFLLCYFPLAATIVGLVTFFALTDWHARRPYLRYNPFVAAGVSDKELESRRPAVGETAAGSLGAAVPAGMTMVAQGQVGNLRAVPKGAVPPPAAEGKADYAAEPAADLPMDIGRVTGVDLPLVDQSPDEEDAPPKEIAPPAAGELPADDSTVPTMKKPLRDDPDSPRS